MVERATTQKTVTIWHIGKKVLFSLRFFYSWIGLLIGIPVAFLLFIVFVVFVNPEAGYQMGGLVFLFLLLGPVIAAFSAILFAILLINIFHKKETPSRKKTLILVNILLGLAFIPLPNQLLHISMTVRQISNMHKKNQQVEQVKKYQNTITVYGVHYEELDRTKNGIKDSILVTFRLNSQVTEPLEADITVDIKGKGSSDYLMVENEEYSGLDSILVKGEYACQTYLHLPNRFDHTKLSSKNVQRLIVSLQHVQTDWGVPHIADKEVPIHLHLDTYERLPMYTIRTGYTSPRPSCKLEK